MAGQEAEMRRIEPSCWDTQGDGCRKRQHNLLTEKCHRLGAALSNESQMKVYFLFFELFKKVFKFFIYFSREGEREGHK